MKNPTKYGIRKKYIYQVYYIYDHNEDVSCFVALVGDTTKFTQIAEKDKHEM